MHYNIETHRRPNTPGWLQCVEKTKVSTCFQRFQHANFWLLIELDTFASTHSRDLLPHTIAQLDSVAEAMFYNIFRCGDGKP